MKRPKRLGVTLMTTSFVFNLIISLLGFSYKNYVNFFLIKLKSGVYLALKIIQLFAELSKMLM